MVGERQITFRNDVWTATPTGNSVQVNGMETSYSAFFRCYANGPAHDLGAVTARFSGSPETFGSVPEHELLRALLMELHPEMHAGEHLELSLWPISFTHENVFSSVDSAYEYEVSALPHGQVGRVYTDGHQWRWRLDSGKYAADGTDLTTAITLLYDAAALGGPEARRDDQ